VSVDFEGAALNWEATDRTSLRGSVHRRVMIVRSFVSRWEEGRVA
jgi:hypothetical protein